jgi:hypothetical protein
MKAPDGARMEPRPAAARAGSARLRTRLFGHRHAPLCIPTSAKGLLGGPAACSPGHGQGLLPVVSLSCGQGWSGPDKRREAP